MDKKSTLTLIALLALTSCFSLGIFANANYKVCGQGFDLEVAKTNADRSKGLMFRKSLDPKKGMIFIFKDEKPLSFWMKNVPIPLDILFFDAKGALVSTQTMEPASPLVKDYFLPQYKSEGPAQFVVELAEGSIAKFSKKEIESCRLKPLPKIDETVEP